MAKQLTAQERFESGKKSRDDVSRQSHALLDPQSRRFDPLTVLRSAAADRVHALLKIKYERMLASPFSFFRGAVSIMAADLARLPHTGISVQLCGDAHVQNLGSFATPDGRLVFDLNDFDETIRGPWEWDVKRMAASFVLAGRELAQNGDLCKSAAEAFVASYCRSIREFARMPILQVARHVIHREQRVEPVHAALRQSERAHPLDLLKRFTQPDKSGTPRFINQKPVFWRLEKKQAEAVLHSLRAYRETLAPERRHLFDLFRPIDVGFKVVGTGSVGLRDYVVLLEGSGPRDPLFLQIKQEAPSAYTQYLPGEKAAHQGRRTAEGQRAIQPISDLLLGWTTIEGRDYLVRQLNDHKGSIDLRNLRGGGLRSLAIVAGEIVARGHARSGDACQIAGYCGSGGKVTKAIGEFAVAYADQTNVDYQQFRAALSNGKLNGRKKVQA